MSDKRKMFEGRIAAGADNAMMRFALGKLCSEEGDQKAAIENLKAAIAFDPDYSAAWALLGKAYGDFGDKAGAVAAYREGVDVAERKGDLQAARQMRVFLKRLER